MPSDALAAATAAAAAAAAAAAVDAAIEHPYKRMLRHFLSVPFTVIIEDLQLCRVFPSFIVRMHGKKEFSIENHRKRGKNRPPTLSSRPSYSYLLRGPSVS